MSETLTVDNWSLHTLTLDCSNQAIPGTIIANAADAYGRGIDLWVTHEGSAVSMSGMSVYLLWSHQSEGTQGQTEFTAVDASAGHWKVYYPAGMMRAGTVIARISVYIGDKTPITGSRNFCIHVEGNPVDEDSAMASDDFSAFVQATIDLHALEDEMEDFLDEAEESEAARVTAETARVSAENTRIANESSRVSAESARASAESARETAETARASAEATRQANETSRQTAESARASAESSRVTAETSRRESSASAVTDAENAASLARAAAEAALAAASSGGSGGDCDCSESIDTLAKALASVYLGWLWIDETAYGSTSRATYASSAVTLSSSTISSTTITLG